MVLCKFPEFGRDVHYENCTRKKYPVQSKHVLFLFLVRKLQEKKKKKQEVLLGSEIFIRCKNSFSFLMCRTLQEPRCTDFPLVQICLLLFHSHYFELTSLTKYFKTLSFTERFQALTIISSVISGATLSILCGFSSSFLQKKKKTNLLFIRR